jgi:hypothetical protein
MPALLIDAPQETLIWLAEVAVAAGLPGIVGGVVDGVGPEPPEPQLASSADAQSKIACDVPRCMAFPLRVWK